MQSGRVLGTLDRRLKQDSLDVELKPSAPLDLLVENMGRVNFGPNMLTERKGIVGIVTLGGEELKGWEIYTLPLTVPAGWLREGSNKIVVLDLEPGRSSSVQGIKELLFETTQPERKDASARH